jgi:RNA polymerase sigma-70 factor (ECF subfamily)
MGDSRAIPALHRGHFPLPHDLGPEAAQSEADAATSRQSADSDQPWIPASPGAAVLKEFDPLYHKYQRRVYRQCYRMLGNQEEAEDLTQEVFLQLFRKAHTFRGDASFSTWLYRLTVNTVLMQLRRRRRWHEGVTSLDVAPGSSEAVSDVLTMLRALPDSTTATLDKICLDAAIAQLSSGYKEILLLHDLEGYRHDEIAKLLGISEGTSKSQLHKARLRLRALIGSDGAKHACRRPTPAVRKARKKRCPSSRAAECVPA